MPNTEKPAGIAQQKKSGIDGAMKKQKIPVVKTPVEKKIEKVLDTKTEIKEDVNTESKTDEKKVEEKSKPVKTKPNVKRDYAIINAKSVPISTKYSIAICKFIKGKTIEKAISDLEPVLILKKAIPMRGEIPHRKGKIMSGRFPQKAVGHFIKLLKNLEANAIVNELNDPVIIEAISNLAQRPYGRFGRTKKKRTHVTLKCVEKKIIKKKKTKEKK